MDDRFVPRRSTIRLETGPRLHYAEFGAPDGDPVLFLHGWPDSWFSFSRVLPLLPHRLRAIAIDQRGFGDSERPESRYAVADLAGDATAFLNALHISQASVIGHSFGSFVARQMAIAHPHRVTRIVLIGTGFSASNPVTRQLQKALHDLPDPIPVAFARDFQASTVHLPIPTDFFDQLVSESLKLPPRLWRLAIDRMVEYDDTAQLNTIGAPILLLWGDHDALFSRTNQDDFLAAQPSARLKVYENTGHCPNWERPELVAADIANFVQRT